jgi:uncharacterized protein (TIGR02266 family)
VGFTKKSVAPSQEATMRKENSDIQGFKDIERLEKQDWHLWLLTIFIILILTAFIMLNYYEELSGTPREFFKSVTFIKIYIIASAVLIFGFCILILYKNFLLRRLRKEIFIDRLKKERSSGTSDESAIFFPITSAISAHKDVSIILELIAKEALNSLHANRSTVFLLDAKSGILKTQYTHTPDPHDEQVGLFEEKEIARKVLRQKRTFLLRQPEDFSEFLKYENRERKITSLLSIPLYSQGKAVGVLSLAGIDDKRSFNEKNLQFFSIFGHHASMALENAYMTDEVRKGISFRKSYEGYLDDILNQLQALSEEERRRIEEHIGRLLPVAKPVEKQPLDLQEEEVAKGVDKAITLEEPGADRRKDDRLQEVLRVEYGNESLGMIDDLSSGGVFIRTPDPLDLGEQFLLKLHMPGSQTPLEVNCKVVWTNKYGKESRHLRRGMGVKFLDLQPEIQKRVEDYIRSQKDRELSFEDGEASLKNS